MHVAAQRTTMTHHPCQALTRLVLTLLAALCAPGAVLAQGGAIVGAAQAQAGAIEGAVTDATGLVLPGVTVEARSAEAGGAGAVAVTDGAGAFTISGLAPGAYDVTFTLPGFHEVVRAGVAVGAGATVQASRSS